MLLFPYVTTPRRIADTAIEALRGVPDVHGIRLFGSLARRTADGLSDIDLVVGCEGDAARACAEALHAALPVRYYRPLSGPVLLPGGRGSDAGSAPPSGRYWHWGESAFHWIDLCLLPAAEYERVVGARGKRPPPGLELSAGCADHAGSADDRERVLSRAVLRMLKAAKAYLRGECGREELDERYRALLREAAEAPPDRPYAGGTLGDLVAECLQIRLAIGRAEGG